MNLQSCNNCGVVIDMSKLTEPEFEDEESIGDSEFYEWCNGKYVPTINCPVCKTQVMMR